MPTASAAMVAHRYFGGPSQIAFQLDAHQTASSRKPCQQVVKGKGEAWKRIEEEKDGRGKKLESVSEARKRKLGLTAYAIGVASMEEDFNSLNFFIVKQQK